jgi:uncharacterized protein with HEPN domain
LEPSIPFKRRWRTKHLQISPRTFCCLLAVERSFEIISEASRRIPIEVKAQRPEIDWLGMADFGNRLRHAYHRVDANLLWQIAERDLPPLKAFVESVVGNSEK